MGMDTSFISGGAKATQGVAGFIGDTIKAIFSTENIFFFFLCGAIVYVTFWWIIKQSKDKGKMRDSFARRRRDI